MAAHDRSSERLPAGVSSARNARSLSGQIYDTLRGRILRREIPPGEKLTLRELAESLGMSITPVRDAVSLLAADRLVAVSPRRGTVVVSVTPNDLREVYFIRSLLEPGAAEIAATSLSETELHALTQIELRLERTSSKRESDPDAYMRALTIDAEFHVAIIQGARNRSLDALYAGVRSQCIAFRAILPNPFRDDSRRAAHHRAIIEALRSRDGVRARQAMEIHLRSAQDDILPNLRHFEYSAEGESAS